MIWCRCASRYHFWLTRYGEISPSSGNISKGKEHSLYFVGFKKKLRHWKQRQKLNLSKPQTFLISKFLSFFSVFFIGNTRDIFFNVKAKKKGKIYAVK